MKNSRMSWIAGVFAIAAILAIGSFASVNSPATAGDGCCPSKSKSSASPAATVSPVAMTAEKEACCPYSGTQAAADKSAWSTKDAASCAADMPQSVRNALTELGKANSELAKAIDSGASDREIRELAIRAGGAYAAVQRQMASEYKKATSGPQLASTERISYARWSKGVCPVSSYCGPDKGSCGTKEGGSQPAAAVERASIN